MGTKEKKAPPQHRGQWCLEEKILKCWDFWKFPLRCFLHICICVHIHVCLSLHRWHQETLISQVFVQWLLCARCALCQVVSKAVEGKRAASRGLLFDDPHVQIIVFWCLILLQNPGTSTSSVLPVRCLIAFWEGWEDDHWCSEGPAPLSTKWKY